MFLEEYKYTVKEKEVPKNIIDDIYIKIVNKYHQKHKKSFEKYQNSSEEQKYKRQKKAQERYQNFFEEEKEKSLQYYQECKQKLPEYRRNYY